jgi:uncharacterized protein YukE
MADLKMVYEEAEEMIQRLFSAAQQLEETITEVQSIADVVDNGALQGQTGDALANQLRQTLCNSIQALSDRIMDAARYIRTEKEDMQEAERQSSGLFGG